MINRDLARAKQNKNSLHLSVSVNDLQSFSEWLVQSVAQSQWQEELLFVVPLEETYSQDKWLMLQAG